jgi:hypothetical protein
MAYDHYRKFLYVFCGAPEFEVKIVNFENGSILDFDNKKSIEVSDKFLSASFSFHKNKILTILNENQLINYQLAQSFTKKNDKIQNCIEFESSAINLADVISKYEIEDKLSTCFWDLDDVIYISTTTGKLVIYSFKKKCVLREIKLDSSAKLIFRIEKELYILDEDGFDKKTSEGLFS